MPYLAGSTRRPVGMLCFGTAGGTRRIEDARFTLWNSEACVPQGGTSRQRAPKSIINFGFEYVFSVQAALLRSKRQRVR
jgi:hypothetical protein